MFWVGCLFLSLCAEQSLSMDGGTVNLFSTLLAPTGTDFSNPLVATFSLMTDVWQYFKLLIQVIVMWFPDLWVGTWQWFYFFVVFPVSVMMIATFVTILRGAFVT
jgi:hypothetical protein